MSLDIRDARRFRAMEAGWKARDKGLPMEAMPTKLGGDEREWWATGWRWREDQLALAEARAQLVRLRGEINDLRGGNRP